MSGRLSIRDLAKIAGVSRTTVSLALRGSSEVSAKTRDRIKALAKEHGYRSHPSVDALMQQVRRGQRIHDEEIIAFIRSGSKPDENAPGPLELLEGIREEAHRMGYNVEVFWAGNGAVDSEKLARVLYHRGIRGVIWAPMPYPHPPLQFPWELFVPIACTSSTGIPNLPVVRIRHATAMGLLLEEIQSRGATRIGVVIDRGRDSRQNYGWTLGVDLYRHRSNKAEVLLWVLDEFDGFDRLPVWIKEQNLDALILTQEHFTRSATMVKDIPRASLDVPTAELGKTAGLFQDMVSIGRHSVRSLSIRLSNGNLGLPQYPYSLVTEATFVDGTSLGKMQRDR